MTTVVLLLLLGALGALVVALDRLAANAASENIARALREAEGLDASPDVHISGPFLLQVARGRFRQVDVGISGLHRDGLRLQRVDLRLHGVHFPASAAMATLRGEQLERLRVDRVEARLLLDYDDISALLRKRGLGVEPGPDGLLRVRVLNPVPVLGSVLVVGADSSLRAEGTHLVVRAERFLVGNGIANALVSAAIGGRFDFRVDIGPLPVPVRSCAVTEDGLVLSGEGEEVVLDTAA